MKYTEQMIEKLEAVGFNRWTKGSMDRLYINAKDLGLVIDYYKTGNIHSAEIIGDSRMISNAEARRMLATKTYIDLTTGDLVCDNSILKEHAEELIANALKEEEQEEPAEEMTEEEIAKELEALNIETVTKVDADTWAITRPDGTSDTYKFNVKDGELWYSVSGDDFMRDFDFRRMTSGLPAITTIPATVSEFIAWANA